MTMVYHTLRAKKLDQTHGTTYLKLGMQRLNSYCEGAMNVEENLT